MNKITVVFCEGDHDIAFLIRLLSINNYRPYDQRVENFPNPFNKHYLKKLSLANPSDRKFKFQRSNPYVPYSVFEKNEDELVIFHNLDGDGNILTTLSDKIKNEYLLFNDEIVRRTEKHDAFNFRFLYFFDADDAGVDNRLKEFEQRKQIKNITHHVIRNDSDYEWACYVFHNHNHVEKQGKLEDILLELMTLDNEDIFHKSMSFIKDNCFSDDNRKRKFDIETSTYKGSIQYKNQKSIISIAGQLQFSGSSNSVIIANTDYIKRSDIENNEYCRNIINLFNRD